MPTPESLSGHDFQAIYDRAGANAGQPEGPFSSPEDWRDQWIYFLMVDRFNNPAADPKHSPFDDPNFDRYQGGTYSGVREQLGYIKELGAGAIWLSPVLENMPFDAHSYHGCQSALNFDPGSASNIDPGGGSSTESTGGTRAS
jgi:hypothetical protein